MDTETITMIEREIIQKEVASMAKTTGMNNNIQDTRTMAMVEM